MKKFNLQMFLLAVLLLSHFGICNAGYAQANVTRQILGSETSMPEVSITVTPNASITSYYIVEFLNPEITPIYISAGGVINYYSGMIKWGPFEDNLPRTVSYKMIGSTTAFEIAGYGEFSTDPAAQTTKTYSKVYTGGDVVGIVTVPISHDISVLEPGVVYTVTTQHYALYDGQTVAHPNYYPELQLLNSLRNNVLAIRAYHGAEGTGFVTMKKTAPYTTPVEWNISELEVLSVTATPISNPEGLEVTWTFQLSSTALWDVYDESICLGIFSMTDAGDYGAYCDLSNLKYTGGIPKTFKAPRGIYVWKEGELIASTPKNQRDFFSFCAAPKGVAENKIESVIIAFPGDINGTDNTAIRNFVAEAHSRNMEVHYVTGEPEWSFLDNRQIPTNEIDEIFIYNEDASIEERFDSIQFDVEPHAIDTDNEPGMEPWVWEQYIQNMDYFKSVIDQNNAITGLSIPFSAAIGNFWHEDYVTTDSYVGTGYEQIINIIDKVVIMNYVTHYGAIFTCQDELEYARLLNKPVEIVYETFNTSPTESFWFNGNNALERIINSIDYAYVDPLSSSYYEKMECNVIHYYETEDEYFPYYDSIKRSYRQLRADIFDDYEPLIPVSNAAPVCYVLSPNGGGDIDTDSVTISYEVYDDNSSVPVLVKFYLENINQGTEDYLGEESIIVNSSSLMYSGSFTADVQAYSKASGYRILIIAEEQSGTPLSGLDRSNYDFTLIDGGQQTNPPVADAGGPYSGAEGDLISLSASNSYSPEGLTLTFAWDMDGDGQYDDAYGENVSYIWNDSGSFLPTVRVTDSNNGSDVASATATISNVAPTVDVGSDSAADEGETIYFSGYFDDPGSDDTHTIEWDFGDGTVVTGILSPSHVYSDNGIYTVTLTVTDDDSAVDSDTLTVTVSNVAPSIDAGSDIAADEGDTVYFSGYLDDPGSDDTHTIEWDLGDGTVVTGTLSPSHVYSENGVYTVTLTVTDDDNAVDSDTITVTVSNVAPSVYAGPDLTVNIDELVNFSGSFTDPGSDDTHTIEWNLGDSATASGTLNPSHTYTSAGSYTVALTVTDDDGSIGTDTLTVTVKDNSSSVTHDELVVQIYDIVSFAQTMPCSRERMRTTLLSNYLYPARNYINAYNYSGAISELNDAINFLNKRARFFNAADVASLIADIQQLISDLESM